jgi:hypothetical protein
MESVNSEKSFKFTVKRSQRTVIAPKHEIKSKRGIREKREGTM